MDKYDEQICKMLKEKEEEMVKFINRHLSKEEIKRIGEMIIRIMPSGSDIAKIKIDNLQSDTP